MISTVSLVPQRSGILLRLLQSCRGDAAAYGRELIADLRGLAADTVAWHLAALAIVSQVADALTTMIALANNAPEGNPLTAAVLVHWGVAGLLAEKVVISAVVLVNMARLRGRSAWALGAIAILVGFGAAAWNFAIAG
ncbi:MAG TPA: DUF5658 family protein [Candidatus Binatia bacterium]|nr:DUF5658 family protein [Candidatus Binatia bacterium]